MYTVYTERVDYDNSIRIVLVVKRLRYTASTKVWDPGHMEKALRQLERDFWRYIGAA